MVKNLMEVSHDVRRHFNLLSSEANMIIVSHPEDHCVKFVDLFLSVFPPICTFTSIQTARTIQDTDLI